MVLGSGDGDPAQRMSWRSTRRPGQPMGQDDEDRDSVMMGGIPMREEPTGPIALEDPWWSKLTGFRSQRKAVLFGVFIMTVGVYFIIAGTVQERLTRATQLARRLAEVDTSHNSVRGFLEWIKSHRFSKPLSAQIQHIDQSMALQCAAQGWSHSCTRKVFAEARRKRLAGRAGGLGPQVSETVTYEGDRGRYPGSGVYQSELRLPVGVALAYHREVFELEARDCTSGDIFHFECYTVSSRRQKSMDALRRSLYRAILHASADGGARLSGKRLHLLQSLVAQAQRDGVTTEVERSDLDEESAGALRKQLERVEEGRDNDTPYTDVMLYPRTSLLLYRGSFLGLKFHGRGVLYHRRGNAVAYEGGWEAGRIHGRGTLYSEQGNVVWEGAFHRGVPVRPWWVV